MSGHVWASATVEGATAVGHSDTDANFLDAGEDQDADSPVEERLWDFVGFANDLLQDLGRFTEAIINLVLRETGQGERSAHNSGQQSGFHDNDPFLRLISEYGSVVRSCRTLK